MTRVDEAGRWTGLIVILVTPMPGMHAEPVEARLCWSSTGSGHVGVTRSMTWSESFSRTGIFLTILSAIVVALSLVAIGLLIRLGTYIRLVEADIEDVCLLMGMNRRSEEHTSASSWE